MMTVAIGMAACSGDDKPGPTTPTPTPVVNPPRLTAPAVEAPETNKQLDTLRPTLTVRNGTSDQAGTRTYEFQISDNPDFTAIMSRAARGYRVVVTKPGVPEGGSGTTSFTVDEDLQPTTKLYWRARLTQGTTTSEWSQGASFRTRLMGFSRPGELYDPLIHGETVGQVVGDVTFVPGKGVQLNAVTSHIRYLLPATVSSGEYSMDVEGLRANGPGDKAKVFGMQEGQGDFITNDYRVDIQYRGTAGFPPNAIQWRVIYGDADDLSVRYEPDTAKRFDSVFQLNGSTTYHWKFNWGPVINLKMIEGGVNGTTLYDFGMPAPRGAYTPNPHYAYLGAPLGRSGNESASIPGTIYRNVWLGSQPRPASLGSALLP
ncbi:MAG: hypothetical protein ABIT71_01075 [Vicinamibacteraceae bacterium]